jgi:Thioredoxin-like
MKTGSCFVAAALLGAPLVAHADWESSILPKDFMTASSFDRAIDEAKKAKRPVILYYTRTECPPCTVLQGRLRKDEIAKPYRDGYVFTAVWGNAIDRSERERYRSRYGARGAPTWIAFSEKAEYVCTAPGGFQSDGDGATLHTAIQAKLNAPRPPEGAIVNCI